MKKRLTKIKKTTEVGLEPLANRLVALLVNGCLHLSLLGTPVDEWWVL